MCLSMTSREVGALRHLNIVLLTMDNSMFINAKEDCASVLSHELAHRVPIDFVHSFSFDIPVLSDISLPCPPISRFRLAHPRTFDCVSGSEAAFFLGVRRGERLTGGGARPLSRLMPRG